VIEATARSLARRMYESSDPAEIAGIRAALQAGGYDPATTERDHPTGYNERAASDARAWNPAYLTDRELAAKTAAFEAAVGGAF
jgi:hypothetical protein